MHVAKLVVVNWGLLSPREFSFEQAVLLSGANGAGKTTLLDAMQSVMSATLHGVMSYNRAQGEASQTSRDGKSKRTLASYIVGTDEGMRKHPQGATGYLAMVFKPSQNENVPTFTAILGARVSVGGTSETVESLRLWLLAGEAQLSDFVQDTEAGQSVQAIEQMTTHLRLTYGTDALAKFDDAKKEYLCALYARLQGSKVPLTLDEALRAGRTWCSLIGLKGELGNIHQLVRDQLLAAPDMGDEVRRSADIMKGVRMVRQDFERLRKTEVALDSIHNAVVAEIDTIVSLSRAQLKTSEVACDAINEQLTAVAASVHEQEAQVQLCNENLVEVEAVLSQKNAALQEAERAYARASEENGESKLLERLSQLEEILKPLNQRFSKVKQVFEPARFIAATEEAPTKGLGSLWPRLRKLSSSYEEALVQWNQDPTQDPSGWLGYAQSIQAELRSAEGLGELMAQQYELGNKLGDATKEIQSIQTELSHAQSGSGLLPREVAQLKDDVARMFPGSRPRVVAECVEVLDKAWQPAIEAFLGKFCYALLVEDKHEVAVAKHVSGLHHRRDIPVIQGSKLGSHRHGQVDDGSLMDFLHVDQHAEPIIYKFLVGKLGRVQAAHSQEELQYMARGLTADGYSVGGDVWQRKMDLSRAPVFGLNAGAARCADLQEQLSILTEKKSAYESQLKALKSSLALLQPMTQLDIPESGDFVAIQEQYAQLTAELASARDEDLLAELRDALRVAKTEYEEAQRNLRGFDKNHGRAQADLEGLQQKYVKLQADYEAKVAFFDKKKAQILEALSVLEGFDEAVWLTSVPTEDAYKLERSLVTRHNALEHQLITFNEDADTLLVTPAQTEETGLADLSRLVEVQAVVDNRLASLRNIDIKHAADRLRESEISFSSTFTSTFCDRVLSQVEAGKRELEAMNQSLKKLVCQGESFQIVWDKDPAMSSYLGLFQVLRNILDDRMAGNIFQAAGLSPEHAKLAGNIYALLLSDNDVVAERELNNLADYRNYLRYDIIRKTASGHTDRLSTWGTGSGGQFATPVTVIRAAVLASACKLFDTRKASHLRMLAMDEAFARLDGQRTQALMSFLTEQLGLQVFCAMPTKDAPMIRGSFQMEYEFLKSTFDAGGVKQAHTDVRFSTFNRTAIKKLEEKHIHNVTEAAKTEFRQNNLF